MSIVNLSVTTATVTEDGPQNLFYVFSRTGDTTAPLTVNFNVGGGASFGSDYGQRGASSFGATSGTITFASGASVAILTLDPLSDAVSDGNETVALTLVEGAGYGVGTPTAVTGTILDNDVAPGTVVRGPIARSYFGGRRYEVTNVSAFAALKSDGSVVTWGYSYGGGDSSAVASQLSGNVVQIFSTYEAFAALKSDGSVVTWGNEFNGGNSGVVASQLRGGVTQIVSTAAAFAALKNDGSVVTWGGSDCGGNSSAVASQLSSGVTQIFSTGGAFAALKSDGSVVTWGWSWNNGGGQIDSSGVASQLSSGVTQIFSTGGGAFAALKSDGSVVTWGDSRYGGSSAGAASQLSSGVTQIFSTDGAFAALKNDGSVVTWGDSRYGGNSSSVTSQLSTGVTQIFSTERAFAALKGDGSVVTWGWSWSNGGSEIDSSGVASQLSSGVTQIFSNAGAFAALKNDGSVVTWGQAEFGGNSSIVTWNTSTTYNYLSVASQLSSGVTQIFSTGGAFAALKSDGSVVTWGYSGSGGNSSIVTWNGSTEIYLSVADQLSNGVTQIFSGPSLFAALKSDGSVVTWGYSSNGGNSSGVASQLASGVVSFADPFNDDRLVPGPPLPPIITLTVSPSVVDEDGATNLVYTFTRTSDATNPLTVNYSIAGTADASDYTGSTPGTGKTITFAAGSNTATLTLDPTADNNFFEDDETVALTLVDGIGYTVGTTVAVVGTIANDDLPSTITLAVSPATVTEDGPPNLVYTFSRTGDTTNPLTVNYTVGGTATLGSDYTGVAPSPATKTVTFLAGSSTATLTIDPTVDSDFEADETVTLNLVAGTDYTVGTPVSVTGTIIDDDPLIQAWTRRGIDGGAYALATGLDGSIYMSGYTFGNLNGPTGYDAFVTKYGSNGTQAWTRIFGTPSMDVGTALTTDLDGSIYVAGHTGGSLNWQTNRGDDDAFIAKYNPDGTPGWTELLGTSVSDIASDLTTGLDGAIYVSGGTRGSLDGQTNNGDRDAFIAKYNPDGTKAWTRLLGTASNDSAGDLTTGLDGSIYITGYTYGNLDGQTNNGDSDAFIVKYNPDGTKAWTRLLGTASNDSAGDLTTGLDGSIYITGYTYGNLDGQTNNGGTDAFIAKYNPDGTKVWTRLLGTASDDSASALTIGLDGSIYITGYTYGNLDGQTNNGGTDAFIAKYNPDGTKAWTRLLGTASHDSASALTIGLDGNLYVGGTTGNTGSWSAFVTKFIINNLPSITLAIAPASVTEDGTTNLAYTFTRTGPTTDPLTVSYTVGGTATLGTDYTGITASPVTKTVTFLAGSDTATVTVDPTADADFEADETVTLTLATGTGYTVGTTTAVIGTILNDDLPVITLGVSPSSVSEDGATNLVYTFTRSGITTNPLTVNYTIGGSANASDYTGATPGIGKTITFAAGSGTATLIIDPTADTTIEADETVALTLATGTGYTVGTTTAVTGTILDDDLPVITLGVSPSSVSEDGATNLV